MSPTVCFTSVTCGYLPRARILAASVRKHQPDWALWAVLVDVPPPGLDLKTAFAGFDRVLDARTLIDGDFDAWVFGHDAIAACCAVKGPMLRYLLKLGAARIVYLDPDIALFAPLALSDAPILLTPHRLLPDAGTPSGLAAARDAMRTGVYNLGFLAVTDADQGVAFAEWWTARLLDACVDDASRGLFVDQKYCDQVPALFPGAETMRDPGCNVATWNLDQRPLAFDRDGSPTACGLPLRFMHFSKHGAAAGERAILGHAASNPVAMELWGWYGRQLAEQRGTATEWRWATDDAGHEIPTRMRQEWRERPDARAMFKNPFATGGGTFGEWWAGYRANTGGIAAARPAI